MVNRIDATFDDTGSWKESDVVPSGTAPAPEGEKQKLSCLDPVLRITTVNTERTFKGGMQGSALALYTMVYHNDPSKSSEMPMASYTGIMFFKGTVQGSKEGEATFTSSGTWGKDGQMRAVGEWTLVPGTLTGGLVDALGDKGVVKGGYSTAGHTDCQCWLEIGA